MCKPLLPFGNSSCIGGCFGNAHVFCFCCSVNALCVLHLIYCCSSRYYIIIMANGKHESDKQNFKLCVPPCPRFITGGDTHSLCVACLVVEHARSALEGADCPYCVRLSMRTFRSRRALFEGGALASVPRGSGPAFAEAGRRLKSWGLQMDLAESLEMGTSFSPSSPARSSTHSLGMEARSEKVFFSEGFTH